VGFHLRNEGKSARLLAGSTALFGQPPLTTVASAQAGSPSADDGLDCTTEFLDGFVPCDSLKPCIRKASSLAEQAECISVEVAQLVATRGFKRSPHAAPALLPTAGGIGGARVKIGTLGGRLGNFFLMSAPADPLVLNGNGPNGVEVAAGCGALIVPSGSCPRGCSETTIHTFGLAATKKTHEKVEGSTRTPAVVKQGGTEGAEIKEAQALDQRSLDLKRQGRYDEAIPLAEQALRIRQRALGPSHADVTASLRNLAALCEAKGDHGRAAVLFELVDASGGLSFSEGVITLMKAKGGQLDVVRDELVAQKRYKEAIPVARAALLLAAMEDGPDHPDTFLSLTNLAVLYVYNRDYGRAEPLYLRALAIQEKAKGAIDPEVATILNNLASINFFQGNYARAEAFCERALSIREKALGPNAPETVATRDTLANFRKAQHGGSAEAPSPREPKTPEHAETAAQTPAALKQACTRGDLRACSQLGVCYRDGTDVPKDLAQAVRMFRRACDGGHMPGCSNLGVAYANGDSVTKDPVRAATLFKQACEGGYAEACVAIGVAYANADGVPKDLARTVNLFKQACDGGAAKGCNNLAMLYDTGAGVPKDESRAAALYQQACDGGAAPSCYNLGFSYLNGEGVPKDKRKAAALFKRACDGGHAKGCQVLETLDASP
jgi:TPR repeat protein